MTPADCLAKAQCDACPLKAYWQEQAGDSWERVAGRVQAEFSPAAAPDNPLAPLLVARSPGKEEAQRGRPMIGPWGADVIDALKTQGRVRADVSWTNAVACRFPADDRSRFEKIRRKANKQRAAQGLLPLDTAEAACWPRLEAEIMAHGSVIVFGGDALRAVGVDPDLRVGAPTIDDFGGFPTTTGRLGDGSVRPLMATVMDFQKDASQNPLLVSDIRKAFAVWSGRASWSDPDSVIQPTADALRAWLWSAREPVVFDVETRAFFTGRDEEGDPIVVFDGRKDPIRMIGFYHGGIAYKVHFEPVRLPEPGQPPEFTNPDGSKYCDPYQPEEEAAVRVVIAEWLASDHPKRGHNARMYDRMVCEAAFGVTPANVEDTHPLDKLADSDRRHGLMSLARRFTVVGPWKAEHSATDARSDGELGLYNGRDLKVNALVAPWVRKGATERAQIGLLDRYYRLQDVCVDMHKLGLRFSERKRVLASEAAQRQIEHALTMIGDTAPRAFGKHEVDPINPNSVNQLRRLLYEIWDLPVKGWTEGGDPSTADSVLRSLYLDPETPPHVVSFIAGIRKLRKFRKIKGTYLDAWDPRYGLAQQHDPVGDPDGWYLHTDYNPCGTVGWRFSSRKPNLQNVSGNYYKDAQIGKWCLRALFEAPPGYYFIGSDMDQLELRLAADIAGCGPLIDAFERNEIDTHNLSGEKIYGKAYYDVEGAPETPLGKGSGKFKERRTLVKRQVYLMIYDGSPETMREILVEEEVENEDGTSSFPYSWLTVDGVAAMSRSWFRGFPEFKRWHRQNVADVRRHGYMADPVWGLRRYFWKTSRPNEYHNTPVQFGGGAIVHTAMDRVINDLIPFNHRRLTGLVQQVHDSLMFQVEGDPNSAEAKRLTKQVQDAMTVRVPNLRVTYTAEAKAGKLWSDT